MASFIARNLKRLPPFEHLCNDLVCMDYVSFFFFVKMQFLTFRYRFDE